MDRTDPPGRPGKPGGGSARNAEKTTAQKEAERPPQGGLSASTIDEVNGLGNHERVAATPGRKRVVFVPLRPIAGNVFFRDVSSLDHPLHGLWTFPPRLHDHARRPKFRVPGRFPGQSMARTPQIVERPAHA